MPSAVSVAGRGRVLLVGVDNDEQGLLTNALNKRLDEVAQWSVVEPAQVAPVQLVSAVENSSIDSLIDAAKAADVELLISARVEEETVVPPDWWSVLSPRPQARLTIRLAAFSPRGDEVRESQTLTRTAALPVGAESIPSDVHRRLTADAINQFLGQFQPHDSTVKIKLATLPLVQSGSRTVRVGNREAHRGHWSLAAEYYRRAIEDDPENHAALFNLAVAEVTDRRFRKAEELALKALRLQPDPIYIEGFDKIKILAAKDQEVRYQLGEETD